MVTFVQLNRDWNADPNAPEPRVSVVGPDVLLSFYVNAFEFPEFIEGTRAVLRFKRCERYRLGSTNDEGWYMGKCRFSRLAPAWGEFYKVSGEPGLLIAPQDWSVLPTPADAKELTHYLFYLKDETFECVAEGWDVQLPANPSLQRTASGGR